MIFAVQQLSCFKVEYLIFTIELIVFYLVCSILWHVLVLHESKIQLKYLKNYS